MTPDLPYGFEGKNGEMVLAGRTLTEWAAEHGTPLYIYDRSRLESRFRQIRSCLPRELLVSYAMKANPNLEILRFLGTLYDGVDLASMGEMKRAMEAGIDPSRMSFAGPGKSPAELAFAVDAGIGALSVESERELELIAGISGRAGRATGYHIRVNPSFDLVSSGLKMGGGSKQFGIDSEIIPDILKRYRDQASVRFRGLHFFTGVQNLNPDAIVAAFEKILNLAAELSEAAGMPLEVINLGGGFGIPHHRGDGELDLAKVGEGMERIFRAIRPRLAGTRFKIELGRYIVGECGLYVSRVLYRKVSRGATFLIMDGGMHHYLAASGNMSGNPIHRPMNIVVANRLGAPAEKVSVVGPLCTPLDRFGLNLELPKADEGDLIAVLNAGAYGFSMSPLSFLSHPLPKEVVV